MTFLEFIITVRIGLFRERSRWGSLRTTQHDIGKTHSVSNRKDSWVNGTRTPSCRSLGVLGRASAVGEQLSFGSKTDVLADRPDFRFFETTGLAILTMLIQHYRVETHPKFAGESFEQLKERYSQNILMVTLT